MYRTNSSGAGLCCLEGSLEQNMAILHSMACLYSKTRAANLLTFCQMVVAELQAKPRPVPLPAIAVPLLMMMATAGYTLAHCFIMCFISTRLRPCDV